MGLEPTISDVTGRRFNQIKLHFLLYTLKLVDMFYSISKVQYSQIKLTIQNMLLLLVLIGK